MRRLWILPLVLLVLFTGGCGDDDDDGGGDGASDTTDTSAEEETTTTVDEEAAVAAITETWTTFFNGPLPNEQKLPLLEDPEGLSAVFESFADPAGPFGALVPRTMGVVKDVRVVGADECETLLVSSPCAEVTYDLLLDGVPTLADQLGVAVEVDGEWRVSTVTLCDLLLLGDPGFSDPACQI